MFGQAMKTMGDIIYKLLFDNSALGEALKKVLEFICQIVYWVVNDVWKGFFCPIMEKILPPLLNAVVGFLNFIQSVIDGINRLACAFGACLPAGASVQVSSSVMEYVSDLIPDLPFPPPNCR